MNTEQLAREKALFRYTRALERGDFETVAEVLALAEDDTELETMVLEVNEVYEERLSAVNAGIGARWNLSLPRLTRNVGQAVAMLAFVAVCSIVVLALTGPTVGNTFSSVVSGLESADTGEDVGDEAMMDEEDFAEEPFEPQATAIQVTPLDGFLLPTGTPVGLPDAADGGNTDATPIPTEQRLIIKNGEMRLLVEDTDIAIDRITQIAVDNGGYVLNSQTWTVGEGKSGTIQIAVRSENFETAVRRLRDVAIGVLEESSSGQDVSEEYVDLQSRLANLEATRDRIQTFLDQAKTVDEALEINQELANIEAEIETVKGRMTFLSGRAAFSTIRIDLEMPQPSTNTPTVTPTPTATLTPTITPTATPWSLAPQIEGARDTQVNMLRGLLSALTWLVIVPGPYLLAGGLVWWAVRKWQERQEP